jgi:hypothetical protein
MLDTAFKEEATIASGDDNAIVHGSIALDGSGDVFYHSVEKSWEWTSDEFYNELIALLLRLAMSPDSQGVTVTDDKEIGGKEGNFKEVLFERCRRAGAPMPRLIQLPRRSPKYKETHIIKAMDYWFQGKVHLETGGKNLDVLVHQMVRFGSKSVGDDVADAAKDIFAPEVYVPERLEDYLPTEPAVRPWDRVLKGEQIWELIHERARREADRPYWHDWETAAGRGDEPR